MLKALENGDSDRLPAEIYSRAFYKKYAEYLDLDPEEVLTIYQKQPEKQARTGGRFNFSTVVTLKGKEENILAGVFNRLFIAVIIIAGGVLLFWLYKNYLAPYISFDFF